MAKISTLIPTHIVDDHNDVLQHLLKAIGSKKLKFSHNLLIHFDSHPDLLLDNDLCTSDIYEKDILLDKVSIETWILPLTFPGHINTIVWVKPPWSNQIDDGSYKFYIGADKHDQVKVSGELLYFVSASNYLPAKEFEVKKEIYLHVFTLDYSNESFGECKNKILELIQSNDSNYILDIDLDYFSTLNPFINMYDKVDMYERLKDLYKFDKNELKPSVNDASLKRKKQIETFENIFNALKSFGDKEKIRSNLDEICKGIEDCQVKEILMKLIYDLTENYDEVDWPLVHDAGTTIDDEDTPLPHHPSSVEEILQSMKAFEELLQILPSPKIVTIARSTSDEYCPSENVDFIQEKACTVLKEYFNINIKLHYDDKTY